MPLCFPPVNNQATIAITTADSNILITITSPSTITTRDISSASDMVSTNSAPAISVAAKGQDENFETRLNTMGNAIFKLGGTLEKFISTNSPSGKSRGENDREHLTDFSVNASQYDIDQSPDAESNYESNRNLREIL